MHKDMIDTMNTGKKVWTRPSVKILSIKKDTFSGSSTLPENQGGNGSGNVPRDPTPR